MNAAALIKLVATDGVMLTLSTGGCIKATGKPEVVNHWLPIIRENKADIVTVLHQAANATISLMTACHETAIRGMVGIHKRNRPGNNCRSIGAMPN